jgi:two-component system response regulator FixJ
LTTDLTVYIVDDDEAVRDSLQILLESVGLKAVTFSSGMPFLEAASSLAPGCVLLDVRMPDMDGLEVQERLNAKGVRLPVIVITGHGDVPVAVRAMKAGALDFVEKPFTEDAILGSIRVALARAGERKRGATNSDEIQARLALLSAREREVLDGLVAGLPNKTIAYDLGISPRTVEIHRARVMEKMQAKSLSELVRHAIAAGIEPKTR